ncbi:hypothetical protein [Acidovorax lacteus]|uniref:Uncharacterized protein n=1 Tax=Acidovorax lacteus TaxID=1924988 RepID=A0ABP8L4B2_9BURK
MRRLGLPQPAWMQPPAAAPDTLERSTLALALALWLSSLVLPAATGPDGQSLNGAQVFAFGLGALLYIWPAAWLWPLELAAVASNALLWAHALRRWRGRGGPAGHRMASALLWCAVAALNAHWGWRSHALLSPAGAGFVAWTAAFALVAASAVLRQARVLGAVALRAALLLAVAALVGVAGVGLLLWRAL